MIRVEWARGSYHSLLQRYLEGAFLPLIYPDEVAAEEGAACLQVLQRAQAAKVGTDFHDSIPKDLDTWLQFQEALGYQYIAIQRPRWLGKQYYSRLRE